MDGILNLWKPPGITSHDAVARVRRLTGERRIGHAGTLDPMAEGVLVLGIGQGTRLIEFVMAGDKEYCARIHLGVTTDTDDAEGSALAVKDVRRFHRQTIERALQSFVGRQEQTPPLYAAIKHKGQPAYRLARAGADVPRTPRSVTIYSVDLALWQRPHIVCRVVCSKGAYIRALARDLGERLGCGAHLCGLVRLRSGRFTLNDAVPLPLLEHALAHGYWQELIQPIDEAVMDQPAVVLSKDDTLHVRQGRDIALVTPIDEPLGRPWRAYSSDGELVALLVASEREGYWHADKVFTSHLWPESVS